MKRWLNHSGFVGTGFLGLMIYSSVTTMMLLWIGGAVKPYFKIQWSLTEESAWRLAAVGLNRPVQDLRSSKGLDLSGLTPGAPGFTIDRSPWILLPAVAGAAQETYACYYFEPSEGSLVRVERDPGLPHPGVSCSSSVAFTHSQKVAGNLLPPTATQPLFERDPQASRAVICRLRLAKARDASGNIPFVIRRAAVRG